MFGLHRIFVELSNSRLMSVKSSEEYVGLKTMFLFVTPSFLRCSRQSGVIAANPLNWVWLIAEKSWEWLEVSFWAIR